MKGQSHRDCPMFRICKYNFLHGSKIISIKILQKQLLKLLETRAYPPRRPGCGRGADPGLRKALTGLPGCLSAVLEVLLWLVCEIFMKEKKCFRIAIFGVVALSLK